MVGFLAPIRSILPFRTWRDLRRRHSQPVCVIGWVTCPDARVRRLRDAIQRQRLLDRRCSPSRHCQQQRYRLSLIDRLAGEFAVSITAVSSPLRCATPGAVEAANLPSPQRGSLAAASSPLGSGGTPRSLVHAVNSRVFCHPSPLSTRPTTACPPSLTVTRST
jgi:hypothetical protein